MADHPPLTDEEIAEIRRLHGEGKSLRATAEAIGRSPATLSRRSAELGLEWNRDQTRAATDAKVEDNRARRAALIEWQYKRALKLAGRLDAPIWQTATRTQQGALTDELDFVPTDDELSLARAIGQYAKTAAELEKVDAGQDVAEDRSMLGDLMAKLRGVHRPE